MKFKPNKDAIKMVLGFVIFFAYMTILPSEIVKYCMRNNIEGWNNGPFYEVYSVFYIVFLSAHIFIIGGLFSVYHLIKLMFFSD